MRHLLDNCRVIAIAPFARGFGFVVMEGPETLIDWGLKIVRGGNPESLKRVAELINRYPPDLIVIEDYKHKSCRRLPRARELLRDIEVLAANNKTKTQRISRSAVKQALSKEAILDKHQIAVEIANRFPELSPRLPRFRKPWMSEDYRMSIFGAMALNLTAFQAEDRRTQTT